MSKDDHEPYDTHHPFDAERFAEEFRAEPERIVHAEDDPVLADLAERARQAWAALTGDEPAP